MTEGDPSEERVFVVVADTEAVVSTAWEDGHKTGYEEGKRDGYDEGYKAGVADQIARNSVVGPSG